MTYFRKLWPCTPPDAETVAEAPSPAMARLVSDMVYEVIPLASIDRAIEELPPGARVSVTCSPVKGIGTTLEYCEGLLELGHRPIPHFAARKVESAGDARWLAAWLREREMPEVFVVAGDAPEPAGPYVGALPFLRDLLDADPRVARVGVTGYPDGHALLDRPMMERHLEEKCALLKDAGVGGWISTQMCFDTDALVAWLMRLRRSGIGLPVRLGAPGVVDRARLMTMGARLGIGRSLRFLANNRGTAMQFLTPGGYDPTEIVGELAPAAEGLGVETLHSFTFNAVAETRAWREAIIAGAAEPTAA